MLNNKETTEKLNEKGLTLINERLHRDNIHMTLGGLYLNKENDEEYQLVEFIDSYNEAVFKRLSNQRSEVLSIHDFMNITDGRNISICFDTSKIGDKDWQKAYKKYVAIKPLIEAYQGQKEHKLKERAKQVGVSDRTLRRWRDAYISTMSIGSLIEKKGGWKKNESRLPAKINHLIKEVIKEHYLTIRRPTVESTIREVFKRCHEQEIEKPSKKAIRTRIKLISEKDFLQGRGLRKKAKQKFTAKPGIFPNADYPLAVIQIDHTPGDIILVDDKHRKPIGRPYVTFAIDVYSRMVTGYYISLDAPSVTSVGMCLSRSILPKTNLLLEHDIQDATWDVFGLPNKIHVDNGSDFRAESLQKSCLLHGIDVEYRPVARPEFGGHIERLIGNIMQKVHELPGTTFSNVKQKDEYDSEKHASMTLAEFEKWVVTYITKVYHETPHSSLGRSPNEQWKIGIFGDGFEAGIGIPSVPADSQTLTLDFMPYVERTIQRSGVTIDGLKYYDACLTNFINYSQDKENQKKDTFVFRQDPRDVSYIYFLDPVLKHYFPIPLANQSLPAMSMWEYKALYKKVKQQNGTVNDALIYQAWGEMQNLVENATSNTKSLRRQEQRRKSHQKSQQAYEPLKEISIKQAESSHDTTEKSNLDDIYTAQYEDIE